MVKETLIDDLINAMDCNMKRVELWIAENL